MNAHGGASVVQAVVIPRRILQRLKLPQEVNVEKFEGYDGHLEWELSSEILQSMIDFRNGIETKDYEKVAEMLRTLGVPDSDAQIDHIVGLVTLGEKEKLKEALLSCICIGSRPLVEFTLFLFDKWPEEERSGCCASDAFPPHMTPLMLACILNNLAIVECLLLRGHSIIMPHHKNCKCDQCLRMPYSALAAVQKVDILRALCSDAYLWLSTDDPFAAACALASDLEQFIIDDNMEFREWYFALLENVQRFATRIMDQNWQEQELDLFLSHKCNSPLSTCELPYPRVQMALDCKLKNLIASTNVQRAMDEIWWLGWGNFTGSSARDLYRIFRHVIGYPVLAVLFILSFGKFGASFSVPLARFISNLASYGTFLLTLAAIRLVQSMAIEDEGRFWKNTLWVLEIYMYLYIVGMLVDRYIKFVRLGTKRYFNFWWRWFDCILLICFLLSMYIWLADLFLPFNMRIRDMHRKHLPEWHPTIVYDICISCGCLMAFWRIFYYCQLLKKLGSNIISVGKCAPTVSNYMLIMGVVMISFAIGLHMLVRPYNRNTVQEEDGQISSMADHYGSVPWTLRNLYWSFYGYFDPNDQHIIVGNAGPHNEKAEHTLTAVATEVLTSLYYVVIIMALLNLMISLLVKKAEEVLENEDMEFKYTRVVMISEYLHWTSAVPPPFNLVLILLHGFAKLFDRKVKLAWPEIFIEKELLNEQDPVQIEANYAYMELMRKTFARYRASKEYHYKTVFRTEFERDKPVSSHPKVAFMNQSYPFYNSVPFASSQRGNLSSLRATI